jgi:hypothetical protein
MGLFFPIPDDGNRQSFSKLKAVNINKTVAYTVTHNRQKGTDLAGNNGIFLYVIFFLLFLHSRPDSLIILFQVT